MSVRRYPIRPGGASGLSDLDDVDVTGAAVGRVVAVSQVGPLAFDLVPLPPSVSPQTVALLGDSITEQNSNVVLTPGSPWYDAKGYWTWASTLLGQRFTLVGPDGVEIGSYGGSGLRTDQLISGGQVAACAASGAKWAVVHAGTNDAGTPIAAAPTLANLQTIWRTLTAAGMRVVATTVLPRGDDTVGQIAGVRAINRLIRAAARVEPGVVLCDWFNYVADPATGSIVTDYFYDTTHPNQAGAARMGRALADTLAALTAPDEAWSPMGAADAASLAPNPYMLGDTAGVATSTSLTNQGAGTRTSAKVPRTDGLPGEWQQVVVTAPSPTADGLRIVQQTVTAGTDFAIGDVVYGVCEFETDAAGWDVRALDLSVFCNVSNATATTVRSSSAERLATTVALLRPERGVLKTPRLTVPASTTTMDLALRMYGPCTVRIGRFDIVKVI